MSPPCSPFVHRRRRAIDLVKTHPHAGELLTLYGAILDQQEPVYTWVRGSRWQSEVRSSRAATSLALNELPYGNLERHFRRFVADLGPHGTDEIHAAGATVVEATKAQRRDLLRQTAMRGDLGDLSKALGVDEALPAFYARAFLQAVVEALAADLDAIQENQDPRACPHCGWPPQVAILRDEVELKGRRLLVCSLSNTTWPVSRLACPSCGEDASDKLRCHEVEGRSHLRVDECKSCKGYIKTVDLRREGRAVAVVDDLASIEVDLWAGERELWKICPNLLGY